MSLVLLMLLLVALGMAALIGLAILEWRHENKKPRLYKSNKT